MGTSDWGTPLSFSTKTSYSNVNEQAKLLASNGVAGDRLGYSIAIDSSGDTVIVGAYAADPLGYLQAGAVYVFVRVTGTWSQQAILIADDKANNDYRYFIINSILTYIISIIRKRIQYRTIILSYHILKHLLLSNSLLYHII